MGNKTLEYYYLSKWRSLNPFYCENLDNNTKILEGVCHLRKWVDILFKDDDSKKELLNSVDNLKNCKFDIYLSVEILYSVFLEMVTYNSSKSNNAKFISIVSSVDSTINELKHQIILNIIDKTNISVSAIQNEVYEITIYILTLLKDRFLEVSRYSVNTSIWIEDGICYNRGKSQYLALLLAFFYIDEKIDIQPKEYIDNCMKTIDTEGKITSIYTTFKVYKNDLNQSDPSKRVRLSKTDFQFKNTKEYSTIFKHLKKNTLLYPLSNDIKSVTIHKLWDQKEL